MLDRIEPASEKQQVRGDCRQPCDMLVRGAEEEGRCVQLLSIAVAPRRGKRGGAEFIFAAQNIFDIFLQRTFNS
jgi:hypothetical protein